MKSYFWITVKGLTWSDRFSEYVLWLMVSFLGDVWQLNYKIAVTGVNIFRGLADMVPFFLQHIADSFFGNYKMAFLSSVAYAGGLVFLSLSVLGSCNKPTNNSSCHVEKRYKFLFFLALPQLLLGISFHKSNSLGELLSEEQCLDPSKWLRLINIVASIVVELVGTFALSMIDEWTLRFGIPAMCMVVATLFFLSSVRKSIRTHDPPGSFLTTMRRVFVSSFLLRSTELDQDYDYTRTSYGRRLRCLDKAINNLPNNADQEQRDRLIQDVKEIKKAIRRIPFCMAFFVLGIVSSVGDTYFIEQADNMDNRIKEYEVPIVVLQLWYELSKKLLSELYLKIMQKMFKNNDNNNSSRVHNNLLWSKYAGCVGVAVSMFFAILCCLASANVERCRLDKVKDMYDRNGPNYEGIIPMSMFWLLPQYFLLGSFDGILRMSIDLFCNIEQAPTSSDRVLSVFSLLIIGLGRIGSVLSVFVARRVSAWVGKTSWFEDDLNMSRLDKYYWVLAALSLANLFYYNILYYCTSLRTEVRESDLI